MTKQQVLDIIYEVYENYCLPQQFMVAMLKEKINAIPDNDWISVEDRLP